MNIERVPHQESIIQEDILQVHEVDLFIFFICSMRRSFSLFLASHANVLINKKTCKKLLVKIFTMTLTQLKKSLFNY